MVIHSSFVRNVSICATPRVSSHPFTYPHLWTPLINNSLLSMMKASLALVIRLSLTYPHVPDKARMNNHQASYLVSIRLIFAFQHILFWCSLFFKNISTSRLEPTNGKQCCLPPLTFKISCKVNINIRHLTLINSNLIKQKN